MSFLSKVPHRFSSISPPFSLSLSLSSRHTLNLSSPQLAIASPLRLHRRRFAQRRTMKSSRLATLMPFCSSSAAEHSAADSGASPSISSPVQEDEGRRHFLNINFLILFSFCFIIWCLFESVFCFSFCQKNLYSELLFTYYLFVNVSVVVDCHYPILINLDFQWKKRNLMTFCFQNNSNKT